MNIWWPQIMPQFDESSMVMSFIFDQAIGLKLKSILSTEEKNTFVVINETNSEVLNQSVEEDFLDEGITLCFIMYLLLCKI